MIKQPPTFNQAHLEPPILNHLKPTCPNRHPSNNFPIKQAHLPQELINGLLTTFFSVTIQYLPVEFSKPIGMDSGHVHPTCLAGHIIYESRPGDTSTSTGGRPEL